MLINCVRPGVLLTRASCLVLATALMSADLPTLDRPTNATSALDSGSCVARVADVTNRSRSGRLSISRR